MKAICGIVLLLVSSSVVASFAFKCKVVANYQLDNGASREIVYSGKLVEYFDSPYAGDEFIIDKKSGNLTGEFINNHFQGNPVVVTDSGNYIVVTTYPNGVMDVLVVHEYVKQPSKPFVFYMTYSDVVTGLCTPI